MTFKQENQNLFKLKINQFSPIKDFLKSDSI